MLPGLGHVCWERQNGGRPGRRLLQGSAEGLAWTVWGGGAGRKGWIRRKKHFIHLEGMIAGYGGCLDMIDEGEG